MEGGRLKQDTLPHPSRKTRRGVSVVVGVCVFLVILLTWVNTANLLLTLLLSLLL